MFQILYQGKFLLLFSVNFENPIKLGDKFDMTSIEKVKIKEIDSEGAKVLISSTSTNPVDNKKNPSKGMKLTKKKKDEPYDS